MKTAAYLIIALFGLSSCSTDSLIPCEEFGGVQGALCREYRSANGASVGYIEFESKGDSADVRSFYNKDLALQQTITERFKDGRTSAIVTQYPDRPSLVQSWHYNDIDSLSTIVFGANDSVFEISYADGRRKRENYLQGAVLSRYSVFLYFQDGGELFRVSDYNGQDSLLRYRTFEAFSNGKYRANFFTGSNQNLGHRVFTFSPQGLITSSETTDKNGNVSETTTYIYDSGSNLVERTEVMADRRLKSVFLYY